MLLLCVFLIRQRGRREREGEREGDTYQKFTHPFTPKKESFIWKIPLKRLNMERPSRSRPEPKAPQILLIIVRMRLIPPIPHLTRNKTISGRQKPRRSAYLDCNDETMREVALLFSRINQFIHLIIKPGRDFSHRAKVSDEARFERQRRNRRSVDTPSVEKKWL